MIHIICVKWGTKYSPEYVNKLYKGIVNNTTISFSFTCYTDNPKGVFPGLTVPLPKSDLQGWWNKIFMFSPTLHNNSIKDIKPGDRIFYFDLDTIIVDNIDDILLCEISDFIVLSDPYRYGTNNIGSGIMSWIHEDLNYLYDNFKGVNGYGGGDQHYIRDNVTMKPGRWQDYFPGEVLSYKVEIGKIKELPTAAKIIYFHGIPNPHELTHLPWVKRHWNEF